jgi:Histidine kinase-, DNA gyrase B-, and HSP90-like ATPase
VASRRGQGVAQPPDDLRTVRATPEKRFFINMLVRDIELLPAVLDLVDNSVDGARRMRGDERYDGLHVELEVSADRFRISDNCGGIDLDLARNYAFRFGRPKDFQATPGSVGQFGVGMKRALFKLGKAFLIDSRTTTTRFVLQVDVDAWAEESGPEWSFDLAEVDPAYTPGGPDEVGTEIIVEQLLQGVSEDFGSTQTIGSLRRQLQLRHLEAMERGLRVVLNGEAVASFLPILPASEVIRPINRTLSLQEDGDEVRVRIVVGVAQPDREGPSDDDRGEDFHSEPEAGWYVFCNSRLLIDADRTQLTGWGNGLPVYHPQFRQFRGYVYIDSLRSDLLPWNTTKTGVDQDSRVWRRVFAEMLQAGTQLIRMLNRLKDERQARNTDYERPAPISEAISQAPPVPLAQLPESETLTYPTPPQVPRPNMQRITYSVERRRFELAAGALGTSTIADVGRQTFDYFYDRQVDEDT